MLLSLYHSAHEIGTLLRSYHLLEKGRSSGYVRTLWFGSCAFYHPSVNFSSRSLDFIGRSWRKSRQAPPPLRTINSSPAPRTTRNAASINSFSPRLTRSRFTGAHHLLPRRRHPLFAPLYHTPFRHSTMHPSTTRPLTPSTHHRTFHPFHHSTIHFPSTI